MKGAEQLGELLFECSEVHNKVLNWYIEHQDDEVFTTEDGKELRNHIGEMMKQEACAMLVLGKIELMEVLNSPHKDDISEETIEAFKQAMEVKERMEL